MTKKYDVRIIDQDSGKILVHFKGIVEKKSQSSGRIFGDVREDLYVSSFKIRVIQKTKNLKDLR